MNINPNKSNKETGTKSNESPKQEIKVKESPKAAALKKAPDEAIAMAIRDALHKNK